MTLKELREQIDKVILHTGNGEVCVVDRNDDIQQTIELVDITWVNQLSRYVIWCES